MEVSVWGILDRNRYDGNICNIEGNTSEYVGCVVSYFYLADRYAYSFVFAVVAAVNIEFLTEFGDLPLLRSDLSAIRNIDPYLATLQNGYIMNITEYQKGRIWWCLYLYQFIYLPSGRLPEKVACTHC